MSLRTPLSNVRGLGSAKEGSGHFIAQRVTAVALIPLVVLLLGSVVYLSTADYETARALMASPLMGIAAALFLFAAFYHLKLGVQVVIEDYVHTESTRIFLLLMNSFFAYGVGFACLYAVLRLSFAG